MLFYDSLVLCLQDVASAMLKHMPCQVAIALPVVEVKWRPSPCAHSFAPSMRLAPHQHRVLFRLVLLKPAHHPQARPQQLTQCTQIGDHLRACASQALLRCSGDSSALLQAQS